jgi:hypothetical protein
VAQYDFANANLGLDSSGNNNTGTVSGGVTQVAGPFAGTNAAHFDGTGVINVGPLNGGWTGVNGFTFAAWVNVDPANWNGWNSFITQLDWTGATGCFNRLLVGGGGIVLGDAYYWNDRYSQDTAIQPGTWFHVAVATDSSGMSMYVNGKTLFADVPVHGPYDISGITTSIGWAPLTPIPFGTVGSIYDARIYDGALTADEVAQLAAAPSVPEPCALIVWSLLGATGMTVRWWRRKRAG